MVGAVPGVPASVAVFVAALGSAGDAAPQDLQNLAFGLFRVVHLKQATVPAGPPAVVTVGA